MSDTAGRCGWVVRGDEDEVAELVGIRAHGVYETWGLTGWQMVPGETKPDYGPLNEIDPFEVEEDVDDMFILRVEAREGEGLLDVVDRLHNAYLVTCKHRRLVPRTYFFEGFDGRCVALGT